MTSTESQSWRNRILFQLRGHSLLVSFGSLILCFMLLNDFTTLVVQQENHAQMGLCMLVSGLK